LFSSSAAGAASAAAGAASYNSTQLVAFSFKKERIPAVSLDPLKSIGLALSFPG